MTIIKIKSDDITIVGELTVPRNTIKDILVICVPGSGPQHRDEQYTAKNGTFKEICEHLEKNNISNFRYDKRGSFESSGSFISATIYDFAKDLENIINYFSKQFTKIILLGHSEGGATISLLKNQNMHKIILLAPALIKISEILRKQFLKKLVLGA